MSDGFSEFGALNRIGDRLAHLEATGGPSRRPGWHKWLGGLLAIGLVGVALSPAGAEVREVVGLEDGNDRDCLAPVLTQLGAVAETSDGLVFRREAVRAAGESGGPQECAEVMTLKEIAVAREQRVEDLGRLPSTGDTKITVTTGTLRRIDDAATKRVTQPEAMEKASPAMLRELAPSREGLGAAERGDHEG